MLIPLFCPLVLIDKDLFELTPSTLYVVSSVAGKLALVKIISLLEILPKPNTPFKPKGVPPDGVFIHVNFPVASDSNI